MGNVYVHAESEIRLVEMVFFLVATKAEKMQCKKPEIRRQQANQIIIVMNVR